MPKWKSTKKTENQGIIFLESVINENGSIYRPIPGDKDTGIDGFIEFVDSENVTGELIAVQVKTGDSYYNVKTNEFELNLDNDMLNYWQNYMLPVILFFYSPSKKRGAWVSVSDFIKYQQYHGKIPIKKITTSLNNYELRGDNFSDLRDYGKMYFDSKKLFECVDRCLSDSEQEVFDCFMILANHPYSRGNRITTFLAKYLLKSNNTELLKTALFILGYGVGRNRWSWNPNNDDERKISSYAYDICETITEEELIKLLRLIDNEAFHGPDALGERFFDIISCCHDKAIPIFERVATDKSEPIERRLNALYLIYECDEETIDEAYKEGTYLDEYNDLFIYLFESD